MPRIPTYTTQEQANALPGARQQSIASPNLFAGADNAGQVGQGLNALGDSLASHAEELQRKEDTARGTQSEAQLNLTLDDYKRKVATERLGDKVFGLGEEADKFFTLTVDALAKEAPNERVKEYIKLTAERQRANFFGFIGNHAAKQTEIAEQAGLSARISSLKNSAAVDPSLAFEKESELVTTVKVQLNKKGITDPDAIAQATLAETTDLHAGVINTLLVHDAKGAMAYYGQHKDGIAADVRAKMEKSLAATARIETAQAGADGLMDRVRKGEITYSEAEAEARKSFSGDDRNAVISELRSQKGEYDNMVQEQEKKLYEPVNQLVGDAIANGTMISGNQKRQVLSALRAKDPEAYAKAAGIIDAHNDEIRTEQRVAADRARALSESSSTDKAMAGLMLRYDMLQNPDKWKNADLKKTLFPLVQAGTIKASDVDQAITLQTNMRKPVKPPEVASLVSAYQFLDSRIETAIVNGKEVSKMTNAEKSTVKAAAIQVLEPLVQDYQARTGEKASTADIKKIVDSVFVDKKYRSHFLGMTYGDVKTRTEYDPAAAPERVKAKMVSEIPKPMKERIIYFLKRDGYEVSNDTILEAYEARAR